MAKREQKASFMLLIIIILLLFQCKVATVFSRSCSSPPCHIKLTATATATATATRKLYAMGGHYSTRSQDEGGRDDYNDNNNGFYRRQGDVPSPGVGH
ncbi:hypothetical protein SLEP1_g11274 [Rubroshorea leprosula]|uniref:Uncharacterized protein n=1 Tax=Rubroshorea leprosula TaxID=152421 RepID=A0AAV5ILK1_9ROSI|nr:hypothetical protein SLEP1_g11274 [Rubroshorea leprosula]